MKTDINIKRNYSIPPPPLSFKGLLVTEANTTNKLTITYNSFVGNVLLERRKLQPSTGKQ